MFALAGGRLRDGAARLRPALSARGSRVFRGLQEESVSAAHNNAAQPRGGNRCFLRAVLHDASVDHWTHDPTGIVDLIFFCA